MEISIEEDDCILNHIRLDFSIMDYSFSLSENNRLSSLDINTEVDFDQKNAPYIYVKMSPGE